MEVKTTTAQEENVGLFSELVPASCETLAVEM